MDHNLWPKVRFRLYITILEKKAEKLALTDAVPGISWDVVGDGLHLGEDDLLGLAGLAVAQQLANAGDDVQADGQGLGHFLTDELISLAENMATLGVTQDNPLNAKIPKNEC